MEIKDKPLEDLRGKSTLCDDSTDTFVFKLKTNMDNIFLPNIIKEEPVTSKWVSRIQARQQQRLKHFDESRNIYLKPTFYAADQDDTKKLDTSDNQDYFRNVQLKSPGNHNDSETVLLESSCLSGLPNKQDDSKRVNLDEEIRELSLKFESIKLTILCEPLKEFLEFTSALFDLLKTPDDQVIANLQKLKEMLVKITKTSLVSKINL